MTAKAWGLIASKLQVTQLWLPDISQVSRLNESMSMLFVQTFSTQANLSHVPNQQLLGLSRRLASQKLMMMYGDQNM